MGGDCGDRGDADDEENDCVLFDHLAQEDGDEETCEMEDCEQERKDRNRRELTRMVMLETCLSVLL